MTLLSIDLRRTPRLGALCLYRARAWICNAAAQHSAAREARRAARLLARHTDADLADIGLMRADLTPDGVEEMTDRQARAMLRVYR